MSPSPALRCSPGREMRANNHNRGHSFEGGLFFKEKDDDLALFSEMQTRERDNFLLQSSDDLEATFSARLRHFSDIKLGVSIPVRGESSDLLNVDADKNDYDWLLTPPDTPLFPSLDDEPLQHSSTRRGRPRSQPISISRSSTMEKSYRSSRGSASPNRLSPSPRSGNSTLQSRGRPSSARQSSPSPSLRHATPTQRPSTPPTKSSPPIARPTTPTPRRLSTGGSVTSSGIRGVSPVKTNRGNSASPKIKAWQTNIPGFSSDPPPNLRTSLADRPATYVRGSSPAARNGRRQSMSPTASRSVSSSRSHDREPFSCHSKGSVVSSGDDDVESIQSIHVGSLDRPSSRRGATLLNNKSPGLSKKSTKSVSPSSAPKRSFDSAIRQMDHRKSPQNMFRPLLSSVPSTTFYVAKASSTHRSLISRNSSVTTSSNASSDQGVPIDMEHDHNHEFEKVPYVDVPEEVFAFDKMDMVDEAVVHDTHDESMDFSAGDIDKASKIVAGIADPEDTCQSGIVTELAQTSEASLANDDFSEVDSLENMVICSRCGCRYRATVQEDIDTNLCQDCDVIIKKLSRETTLDTSLIGDTTQIVSKMISEGEAVDSSVFSTALAVSLSPHIPDGRDLINFQEMNVVEAKSSCSEQSHDCLQDKSLAKSEVEGGVDSLVKQKEEGMLAIARSLSNKETGGQKLHQNLKVDISEGMGISVLLRRTSSSKGHVVQSRTFSATSIPYDDFSYSKDSLSSMRSSIGHGSFSTSSSADFGSRQSDSRVQRQLSGKKLDTEYYRSDKTVRPPSTGSSLSGVTSLTNQAASLSRSTNEDGSHSFDIMDCDVARETIVTSQEHLMALEHLEADTTDMSSTRTFVAEEDDLDSRDDRNRIVDVELSSNLEHVALQNEECSKELNNKTKLESPDTIQELSCEEHEVDGVQIAICNSTVTVTEIEAEDPQQHNPGSLSEDVSFTAKNAAEELVEASPSDQDMETSTPDSKAYANDNQEEETKIMVESQKGRTKSLTLEEATDTILFCRSIVHDLAYKAAAIATEKESPDPFEGSQPTVTILGKSNHDRRDPPRGRVINKWSSKPQKMKKKPAERFETDSKLNSYTTDNDENAIEQVVQRNIRSPNKIDSLKPPKLESKCNCTIM